MHVYSSSFTITTSERTEVADVTKMVRDIVHGISVGDGIVVVNTLHTTCGLFVNEFQPALLEDIKKMAELLV